MKQLLILVGVLLVTGLIIFGLVSIQKNKANLATVSLVLSEDDHILGPSDNKAVLVEYSDFQCPGCAAYWPMLKQLKSEYGDNLSLVYRHFPLRNIHPNADAAAQAAEAAGLQSKFWEMADMIFEGQSEWGKSENATEIFKEYATRLGLDIQKFTDDFDSEKIKEKIEKNYQEARSLNLPGTPSFFLNGKQITNPSSYEGFKKLIEDQLAG